MPNNNDKYKNHSREELIDELETLKKKKYGLVWDKKNSQEMLDAFVNWENVPENFTPKQFPVLKEVKNKEIENDKAKPINLLIEGDNYHSLAVLNFTHQNKVDVIYIDPPYNTGNNDFVYNDKFIDKEDPFRHSKWLSFMEKRLRLAHHLLKNTGVIFISIDDNEQAQLKLLCDEIFGENNFIANIIWEKVYSPRMDAKRFSVSHDYILVYGNTETAEIARVKFSQNAEQFKFFDKKKNKYYRRRSVRKEGKNSLRENAKNAFFPIIAPDGTKVFPIKPNGIEGCWRWSLKTYEENLKQDSVEWVRKNNKWEVYAKQYLEGLAEMPPQTIWGHEIYGHNHLANDELREFFKTRIFDNPKPKKLIKEIIKLNSSSNCTVLDFMAGSGTTGQAVLELNKEDGGKRKFILCTNNELNGLKKKLEEKGLSRKETEKYGICQRITYPRVEKVINGYKNSKGEKVAGLGGNLKYFKTDFVGSDSTDKNKRDLVNKSAEMICIKEDIFDLVADGGLDYRIYQKGKKFLGVVFDIDAIADFKKEAKKHKGNFVIYCFSYTEATPEKEFKGLKNKYVLKPIPAVILRIYLEIFKK